MFKKIKDGQLSKTAFKKQLTVYQAQLIELRRNASMYGPDLFKSKIKELEFFISFTEIFLEKFDDIVKGSKKLTK